MNSLAVLIVLALVATIGALATGVGAMARGGEFDRKHSTQLMWARVGFQGVAVLLLLAALYSAQG